MIEPVDLHGGGLSARVLTLGAIVQDLRLKGLAFPLVLGSPEPQDYLGPLCHMGAIAGRFANRIGGARVVIDGQEHQLDANWRGQHCLHGGSAGAGQRVWRLLGRAAHRVTLGLDLPDGDMGFPGNLSARVIIRLGPGPRLCFDMQARSDRATPCSLTHHGYFRLDDTRDLSHHRLRLAAAEHLEVDDDLIPTGRLKPADLSPDLTGSLDHGYLLPRRGRRPRPVAWLASRASGLALRVVTTAPALQLHTASAQGRTGLALEAQEVPDAPNHPAFPNAILRPGAVWRHSTHYVFIPPS